MNNWSLGWVLAAPLIAAVVASGLLLASRRGGVAQPRHTALWLHIAVLSVAAAGLMAGPLLLLAGHDNATSFMGIFVAAPSVAKALLPVIHAALLAMLFFLGDDKQEGQPLGALWVAMGAATLTGGALMADDRVVQSLLLFGMALLTSAWAILRGQARADGGDDATKARRADAGERLALGLKHLTVAATATVLLVVGATLLERYGLNMERRALLQLGLGLLSVGLIARAGAMPFAAATSGSIQAALWIAVLMMGAAAPATIGAGLLMLGSAEGTLVGGGQTAWVAALGVLLAGVRAFAILDFRFRILDLQSAGRQERL